MENMIWARNFTKLKLGTRIRSSEVKVVVMLLMVFIECRLSTKIWIPDDLRQHGWEGR